MPRQLHSRLWDAYVLQRRLSFQRDRSETLSRAGRRGAWRRWKRERAILDLQPMVERIARDVRWMFAPHIDPRDLAQAGNVGLVKAANTFEPSLASSVGFESYAYFRVRGAIIDSQKRRTYREESHVSLQAIADAHDGWLPPALDTDRSADAYTIAEREEIHRMLTEAIAGMPALDRRVLNGHLGGEALAETARGMGRSLTWTRARLGAARETLGARMRGTA